ncbi:hypothetical protein XELAEV_18021358mg [Xenopus laevis]|uniref:Reverse transcriptase domain-containing protein n=1 Tax=Xenopus laevis TaxID=8355 RepID=A0A974HRX1_XENLA|nr:hypothetical protein XELAEV_18021358mg [Xenopus laevis]
MVYQLGRGSLAPGKALRVAAYANDVTVIVSSREEADSAASILQEYSEEVFAGTMDHFLLQYPFILKTTKKVSNALGITCLSGLSYQEWAYGASRRHQGFELSTLFLVSSVTHFYNWNAHCQVATRHKVLFCSEMEGTILAELQKIFSFARQKIDEARWLSLWLGFPFNPP